MNRMRNNSNLVWGIILIVIGLVFLLDNYDVLSAREIVWTYWPLVLVLLGIHLIWRSNRESPGVSGSTQAHRGMHGGGEKTVGKSSDTLSESNIMGDVNLRVTSTSFRGGSVNTVFGDTRLDCTSMSLAEGEQLLRISGVFGDVKIELPSNISFRVAGNTLAGSITIHDYQKSGIGQTIAYQTDDYETADKKLLIDISQILGDVKVL
jgi:lia operon protein LiaF